MTDIHLTNSLSIHNGDDTPQNYTTLLFLRLCVEKTLHSLINPFFHLVEYEIFCEFLLGVSTKLRQATANLLTYITKVGTKEYGISFHNFLRQLFNYNEWRRAILPRYQPYLIQRHTITIMTYTCFSVTQSTRSPFLTWLSRLAQSGR